MLVASLAVAVLVVIVLGVQVEDRRSRAELVDRNGLCVVLSSELLEVVEGHDVRLLLQPAEPSHDGVNDVVVGLVPVEHVAQVDGDLVRLEVEPLDSAVLEQLVDELERVAVRLDALNRLGGVLESSVTLNLLKPGVAEDAVDVVHAELVLSGRIGGDADAVAGDERVTGDGRVDLGGLAVGHGELSSPRHRGLRIYFGVFSHKMRSECTACIGNSSCEYCLLVKVHSEIKHLYEAYIL